MAGPQMRHAGCHEIAGIEELSVMGLAEVLRHYPRLRRLRTRLSNTFRERHLDVFIGIDVPDFVLHLESELKAAAIPTVHVVCPQVWAWRAGRLPAIRRAVTRVLTLFPFEATFLREHAIDACFIGHPLADRIPLDSDRGAARAALNLSANGPVVALLPGSRRQEYQRHLPLFLAAARLLHARSAGCQFLLGVVNEDAAEYARAIAAAYTLPLQIVVARSIDVLTAAEVALCVSGTITLESALTKTPAVVTYRMPTLTYAVLRRMVQVPYIALPNLLLGQPLIPEYIQAAATPENLAQALGDWLADETRVAAYREQCQKLHQTLRNNAGAAAAEAILALLSARDVPALEYRSLP
jgi:lipid-A-disaccharide synthase